MVIAVLTCLVLFFGCACATPADEPAETGKGISTKDLQSNDLNTDASTYWSGYPGGSHHNHVVGYGVIDDKYTPYNNGGYDYRGYDRGYQDYNGYGGYGSNGGYGGYKGYGGGYSGYNHGGHSYDINSLAGNGGYGGYGGNGGLNSYYGYNSPAYQGGHLGYGYYNKHRSYGNIYNSGITPSLVTGYRGYSRR
ncbi:unnamed protein product [Diatraea saccharalis]|uniref:Uncharacterized protein n=1 Tax=Diatraea saccharalis TaxID=40085 RepID=A0A9N9QX30_9NEOP|nr:unnamed protein product [Diatraea saccharalis]